MKTIKITLSSANMGDVDEVDFDLWAAYVAEKIDAALGIDAEVDQARFGDAGEDQIIGATLDERDAIRSWLGVAGWDAFCGEEWETRRKAHDAAA